MKLQVKHGRRLAVLHAPEALAQRLGEACALAEADVALLFVEDQARLDARVPGLVAALRPEALFWLAYPKLSSPLASDLDRDKLHRSFLAAGWKSIAQIALDDDWSALRFKPL
jgi:hypothetical protein